MRAWIASEHFPEEMRVNILTSPDAESMAKLNDQQRLVLQHLNHALAGVDWTADGITSAFRAAGEAAETGMKDVYRACYALFMAAERGPRLAPILSNFDRQAILDLVGKALDS